MRYLNRALSIITLLSIVLSCSTTSDQASQSTASEESSDEPAASVAKQAVCIWKEISVKEAPEEKGKYKTMIYLGEKISFTGDTATDVNSEKKNKYVKVKLIDNTEGWVRQDFVAIDATPGAIVKEATIYKRPDMMTSSGKSFQQMDFVAVKSTTQDGWTEVIGKRVGDTWFSSGWVKSENITNQSQDVAVSVFYSKAMDIKDEEKRAEAIQQILQNQDLSSSVFYSILAGTDEQEESMDASESAEPEATESENN